jgi:hypothetical protein
MRKRIAAKTTGSEIKLHCFVNGAQGRDGSNPALKMAVSIPAYLSMPFSLRRPASNRGRFRIVLDDVAYTIVGGSRIGRQPAFCPRNFLCSRGLTFNLNEVKLIQQPGSPPAFVSVCFPSSVEVLGERSFSGCPGLSTVTFEACSQFSRIESWTFSSCSALSSVFIPSSAEVVCEYCFRECATLSTVTFEKGSKLLCIDSFACQS